MVHIRKTELTFIGKKRAAESHGPRASLQILRAAVESERADGRLGLLCVTAMTDDFSGKSLD